MIKRRMELLKSIRNTIALISFEKLTEIADRSEGFRLQKAKTRQQKAFPVKQS